MTSRPGVRHSVAVNHPAPLAFQVQGSAAEPYTVKVQKIGEKFIATCSCAAGEQGVICKHRLGIFAGSSAGLINANAEDLMQVGNWLDGSEAQATLQEIKSLEKEAERVKKSIATAKKKLSALVLGR